MNIGCRVPLWFVRIAGHVCTSHWASVRMRWGLVANLFVLLANLFALAGASCLPCL
jgi:hypothetical protein